MRPFLWSLCLMLGVSGCAVTDMQGQRMPARSAAFAAYVEVVFRRQNEIAAELALVLEREPAGSERFAELEDAELALLTDCRSLNEVARARRNGEPASGLGALRRARRAPDCERATERAAALL